MYGQTLETNLDMEGYTPQEELYDEKYQPDDDAGIGDEEQEEYDELWADELREIAAPEIPPPPRVSLKDFPQLKHLTIGDHTLCYLARGAGDGKSRIDSKSLNLVDLIPPTLESLRIYGRGQAMHPGAPYLDYNSDLDVDTQIEQLARGKRRQTART
jgi:hypothetical protein